MQGRDVLLGFVFVCDMFAQWLVTSHGVHRELRDE